MRYMRGRWDANAEIQLSQRQTSRTGYVRYLNNKIAETTEALCTTSANLSKLAGTVYSITDILNLIEEHGAFCGRMALASEMLKLHGSICLCTREDTMQ